MVFKIDFDFIISFLNEEISLEREMISLKYSLFNDWVMFRI